MKNNMLRRVSAIAMVPIMSATVCSCSKSVNNYYNATANYYSDTFVKDNEFEINYEEINENIPMYMDDNPLICVARRDTWDNGFSWLIGYLTYNEENDKVYFYDVEKKDKLDLEKISTVEYDNFFIIVNELGLLYNNHIPLKVIKEVTKSADFAGDIATLSIIDPDTGKEKYISIYDLEITAFKYINNAKEETSTKKLVKKK